MSFFGVKMIKTPLNKTDMLLNQTQLSLLRKVLVLLNNLVIIERFASLH